MCLAQESQRSDAGEARTRGPSVSTGGSVFVGSKGINAFCRLLFFFFQNQLSQNIISGIPTECQTIWIQVRPDFQALLPFVVCFFLFLFFQNELSQNIISGIPTECQLIWIQVRPDLIWIQTVCKGYSVDDTSSSLD